MQRRDLSERNRAVATMLSQGATDIQVCRELGISHDELEIALRGIGDFASTPVDETRPIALCERALRTRADVQVRALQARFAALMETAPEAVLVSDGRTGLIKEANDQAVRLFGRSRRELIGLSVEELVPDSLKSVHVAYRLGFLASSRRREMGHHPGIAIERPDGTRSELAIALTATAGSDDVMVVCTEYTQWARAEGVNARQRESD